MRVAIFTDTYLPEINGVAKTLGRWVSHLTQCGIECRVFAPSPSHRFKAFEQGNEVVPTAGVPFFLYKQCQFSIPHPLHLNRVLKDFSPNLIHSATPFSLGLFGQRYAKNQRIPFVASYHTHFEQYLPHYKLSWLAPVLKKYLHWFHKNCEKIYAPSISTAEQLTREGYPNVEIWGRGVDTTKFQPVDRERRKIILDRYNINPDQFVLLYVGRMAAEKNIAMLFAAMKALPHDIKRNSHLVLLGEGPLYSELSSKHHDEGFAMSCLGFRHGTELSELYAAADAFFFPSATETFGNVVLEAMASGTPVIGANAGGVKDIILPNETGLLCEPTSTADFSKAIITLYKNQSFRSKLAAVGRAYCHTQSWSVILDRLLFSYRDVYLKKNSLISKNKLFESI